MFKAIKEFFVGKPAETDKEIVAEVPYKVEPPAAKVEAVNAEPVTKVEPAVIKATAKKAPAKKKAATKRSPKK